MKVHVIEGDLTGIDALQKRDALGFAIVKLARQVNEPVFFHQFADSDIGGAPLILLECSDAFLNQVRQLADFKDTHPVWPQVKTARSQQIQRHFTPPFPPPQRKPHLKP